jgi:hypothetical protein
MVSSGYSAETFDLKKRMDRHAWIWETPQAQNLPEISKVEWANTEIDHFILARLESENLTASPVAAPETWLRRIHFGLIGLPPTISELDGFMQDHSDNAKERVVDRLLSSPHFGERWARHWMDLVRYAETRGHESDFTIANAYHYRDYLIDAFNLDLPYDRLVREHVSGDLLLNPRQDPVSMSNQSVIATGWAFFGEEIHSPVDIRQDECDRIDNKIDVFSKTFLGLTVSCARCHDHKFDALASRDYYALSGVFVSSAYRQARFESMEINRKVAEELEALRNYHRIRVAGIESEKLKRFLKDSEAYLGAALKVLQIGESDFDEGECLKLEGMELDCDKMDWWLGTLKDARSDSSHPLHLITRFFVRDRTKAFTSVFGENSIQRKKFSDTEKVILDFTGSGMKDWRVDGFAFGQRPVKSGEICLSDQIKQPISRVMTYGAGRRDPFWNKLESRETNETDSGSLNAVSRAGKMIRTPTFRVESGKLHYLIRGNTKVYAAVDSHLMIAGPLHARLIKQFETGDSRSPRWVTHDLSPYIGHRAHVEFGPIDNEALEILMVVDSAKTPEWIPKPPLWFPVEGQNDLSSVVAEFIQLVNRAVELFANDQLVDHPLEANIVDWLLRSVNPLSSGPDPLIHDYVQASVSLKKKVRWQSLTAVTWMDGNGVDDNLLIRGEVKRPAEEVSRGLPTAFPGQVSIRDQTGSGRLELARQLTDSGNPLVSRVMVNRIWHHLFGRGLVSTVDNFGYLGERPSHPRLLDHLAWTFVNRDEWSLKRLIRRLALSSTFAMSSALSDSATELKDPENRLLHRMPVRRLEGEAIRDSLFVVSGRLHPVIGGISVPVHLTDFVVGRGRPNISGPLDGQGRRSLYTSVRRNFLPTRMLTFDVPSPFSTVGRRNITNVPSQSLVQMNDELFHQQAGVWAKKTLSHANGRTHESLVHQMFREAYGRVPTSKETEVCLQAVQEFASLLNKGADSIEVWKNLCHSLFSANEFIYIR